MFDTGNGLIEIFNNGDGLEGQGVIRHFAFATDNVDECVGKLMEAGYNVFVKPKDIEIKSTPAIPGKNSFLLRTIRRRN